MSAEAIRLYKTIKKWTGRTAIILVVVVWGFPFSTAMAETNSVVTLNGITVSGPTTVNEGSSADYVATAIYSDGSRKIVTRSATWSESSSYASINSSGHLVTTSVSADQSLSVRAAFNGKYASLYVTIRNVTTSSTTYTINASAGSNGAISPPGSFSVLSGTNRTFTITANTGYKVQNVLVDGVSVGAVTSYTISNVTANHTISAIFAVNTTSAPLSGTYQTFAFNDLGMHCYDPDFSVFSILPVYNVVHAQVVQKGSTPKIVGSTVNVTYKGMADATGSINTTSIGKTNFWEYVLKLFGANPPLDEGLLGAKMPGLVNQPQPISWTGGLQIGLRHQAFQSRHWMIIIISIHIP